MSRFHLIIQLGPDDNFEVDPDDPNAVVSKIPMVDPLGHLEFGLNDFVGRVQTIALHPSEMAFDLLLLATAVAGVDNRISRASHAQDSWTREICLYIPVSDPDAWIAQQAVIIRALNFLSGDRWNLVFRARRQTRAPMVPAVDHLDLGNHDAISLLSGGLDSCIGAIDLLEQGNRPIFVSHMAPTSGGYQRAVAQRLHVRYGEQAFTQIRGSNAFPRNVIAGGGDEHTTRTRSFLFFAMAAYVANGFGEAMTVQVPENGFITLNVPLDPLRLGALSTRTAHPFYIARWNEFMDGLGLDVTLVNPYMTVTKGQMVNDCANRPFLAEIAPVTMSCASPGKGRFRGEQPKHCGYCLPCLIRRASLLKGLGIGNDLTEYSVELDGVTLNSLKAEGEHIRAFQFAAARLSSNPRLAQFVIFKPGPLADVADQIDVLTEVYRRGMSEIDDLLSNTRTRPS